jgi:hypothetical protein
VVSQFSPESRVLLLYGVPVDTVKCEFCVLSGCSPQIYFHTLRNIFHQTDEINEMYLDSVTEALCRITNTDRELDDQFKWRRCAPSFKLTLDNLPASFWYTLERLRHLKNPLAITHGFVGLGYKGVLAGDIVFILLDLRTPLLLRGVGNNKYVIVGDCYVHGIMDGEFLAKGPKIREIFLV